MEIVAALRSEAEYLERDRYCIAPTVMRRAADEITRLRQLVPEGQRREPIDKAKQR